MCVCVCVSLCVPCVCVYLSLCVCVFLVRSSAGGDHGGAGEERREHARPHNLRRNRQGWQTSSVQPPTWRTGSQVGARAPPHRHKMAAPVPRMCWLNFQTCRLYLGQRFRLSIKQYQTWSLRNEFKVKRSLFENSAHLILLLLFESRVVCFEPRTAQERPAQRGRLHQVCERHQSDQTAARGDHQLTEECRRAGPAGGGV